MQKNMSCAKPKPQEEMLPQSLLQHRQSMQCDRHPGSPLHMEPAAVKVVKAVVL
jgi:hypothetical protein